MNIDDIDNATSGDIRAILTAAYVAAAISEGTPFQRSKLNELITVDDLRKFREDGTDLDIQLAINSVMGQRWQPTGEWALVTRQLRRQLDATLHREQTELRAKPHPSATLPTKRTTEEPTP